MATLKPSHSTSSFPIIPSSHTFQHVPPEFGEKTPTQQRVFDNGGQSRGVYDVGNACGRAQQTKGPSVAAWASIHMHDEKSSNQEQLAALDKVSRLQSVEVDAA